MASVGGTKTPPDPSEDAPFNKSQVSVIVTIQDARQRMSSAQTSTTKKVSKLKKLMKDQENLHLVKYSFVPLQQDINHFKNAAEKYISMINDEQLKTTAQEKFYQKCKDFEVFCQTVQSWKAETEIQMQDTMYSASEFSTQVSSHTHVTSTHSAGKSTKCSSKSGSTTSSLKAKIKKAKLEAEKSAVQKSLATEAKLKEEEFMAEQKLKIAEQKVKEQQQKVKEQQLLADLDVKIARAEAEEAVLNESKSSIVSKIKKSCNPGTPKKSSTPLNDIHPVASSPPDVACSNTDVVNLMSAIRLPQLHPTKFDGDIIAYMPFEIAFDTQIVPLTSSYADRLHYLNSYLVGDAKDVIAGCMFMDPKEGYTEARRLLKKKYGNPYKMASSFLNRLLCWPVIKSDDCIGLEKFASFLRQCENAMTKLAHLSALNDTSNLQEVVIKLPFFLQNKWRDRVNHDDTDLVDKYMNFSQLAHFVEKAAESANDPVFGRDALNRQKSATNQISSTKTKSAFATNVETSTLPGDQKERKYPSSSDIVCLYCLYGHDLDDCHSFLKLSNDAKIKFLSDRRRCFACYSNGHFSSTCNNKRICRYCSKKHPSALHVDAGPPKRNPTATNPEHVSTNTCQTSATDDCDTVTLQAIIPVYVRQAGNDRSVLTYAFYDHGSSGCFITTRLKDELNANACDVLLNLKTMHGRSFEQSSVVCDLEVTDVHNANPVSIAKLYTRDAIPVDCQQIPRPETLQSSSHLQEVASLIPNYIPDIHIGLLIGTSCPAALQPLEVIPTDGNGPFAMRLRHGWTINGPLQMTRDGHRTNFASCNSIQAIETSPVKETIISDTKKVIDTLEMDFKGCCIGKIPKERGPSQEDIEFLKRAEQHIVKVDGHFQIPLPFRDSTPKMPDNRVQAVQRATWQKRKMLRDPLYHDDYVKFVDNLLRKGYAEIVPEDERQKSRGTTWYLPHHAVYHPQKRKIRVVFDCAAKFDGVSLNDMLMQGPDLTNSIVGVLTRFREGPIAFISDVETMFYQVRVPDEECDFLRFVWWPDGDLTKELKDFRMRVHLFGASSSPSIANFALRRTAEDCNPMTGETIKRNFYVDDCLKAVPSVYVGTKVVDDLRSVLTDGGFHLTKFMSNSRALLNTIPKEERAKEVQSLNLDYEALPMERALGVQWMLSTDQLGFSFALKSNAITRRGILSTVASVFDPLGFLAPFVLPAKKILQELCTEDGLGWDDSIPENQRGRWNQWLADLPRMEEIAISRNVIPDGFGDVRSRQLHVFSDASSYGYASCAYLRTTNEQGETHCSFLQGKARLAPLKMMTVPRLELTAATVSVQIGQTILNELETRPDKVVYHTDSTTVLHYINGQTNRFPVFVANRVQQIRDFSVPSQWKYVNTHCNPADCASRGMDANEFLTHDAWFKGPQFLWKTEQFEPQPRLSLSPGNHIEDAQVTANVLSADEAPTGLQKIIDHYSDWHRMKRAVVVYLRLLKLLQNQTRRQTHRNNETWFSSPFTVQEMENSEAAILKVTQRRFFQEDRERLMANGKRPKNSTPLISLDPYLHDGLLRVGGRLGNSGLGEQVKHPVILPKKSHVTTAIIRYTHKRIEHAGRNHVMAAVREKFWVVAANSAVRQAIHDCVVCRRLRRPPSGQKMADLPEARTTTEPPFSYTGVDVFGPFSVTEGRKTCKRYGVLFTCFSSRAVHIEMTNSLETDSFINALRRFLARRGPVRTLYSDRGTNFVGAERELRAALKQMDNDRIQKYLLTASIDWEFNPPHASHFGGVWERQIRTVRKVLSSVLRTCDRLDGEVCETLFCEVEAIVNSRPITQCSNDPDDYEALTPSHILTSKSKVVLPPPGKFQREDVYMRKRWRRVQHLANIFWTRWKREFLLSLQTRQKWTVPKRNLKVGDLVLIQDDSAHRNEWPMGRVSEVMPDANGTVRSCRVKTQLSSALRPIHKLVLLLPLDE